MNKVRTEYYAEHRSSREFTKHFPGQVACHMYIDWRALYFRWWARLPDGQVVRLEGPNGGKHRQPRAEAVRLLDRAGAQRRADAGDRWTYATRMNQACAANRNPKVTEVLP